MSTLQQYRITTGVQQRRAAGAALALIACTLVGFRAAAITMSPNACTWLLLVVLIIAGYAVLKTPGGLTSLVGLLFLSIVVFNATRPLLALFINDDSIYSLTFGPTVEPSGDTLYRLLSFWTIGISSVFAGYFLLPATDTRSLGCWDARWKTYCKRTFIMSIVLAIVLLPVMARDRLVAFESGGYTALYQNQVHYTFQFTNLLAILCPLLYSLSVLIREKPYSRMMLTAVIGYVLVGIMVGRRMEAGSWLLVMLWHFTAIRRKPLGIGRLILFLAITGCAFESIDLLRGGVSEHALLIQFFLNQGLTFLLPALSWQLPPPAMHTIFGSILPLGGIYHVLNISTNGTVNVGSYVCSQSNPLLFELGYGLGSSGFLEVFYLCGGLSILYAIACAGLGCLLHKWEERAWSSRIALFYLCACISSLVSVPRGSLSTLSSQIIYLSILMAAMLALSLSLDLCLLGADSMRIIHGSD